MNRFANKVAVVTGGSSGIGRATAFAFAREGAEVVIAARRPQPALDTVKEIESAGGSAVFVQTDVSRSEDVERLIARTVETYGRLDCAFNNAARTDEVIGPMADLSEEDFDKTVSVNLKDVWLGMKYQIRQMLKQEPRGGVIVNTSSGNGLGRLSKGILLFRDEGRDYCAEQIGCMGICQRRYPHQRVRRRGISDPNARRLDGPGSGRRFRDQKDN